MIESLLGTDSVVPWGDLITIQNNNRRYNTTSERNKDKNKKVQKRQETEKRELEEKNN